MPYLGNEPAVAYTSTTKDSFSGDGSTTAFTMSKSANVNAVRVVVENVIQDPTVAYTCSGTTLTFTSAPPSGTNNIYVVHLGPPAATVAPPTTINNNTTFTGGVTLKNETPEDTDGGRESKVTFKGLQSGQEESTLAEIQASHDGTSDDEKGLISFRTNDGNDSNSPTERWRITSDGHFKAMVNGYGIDFSATEGSASGTSVTSSILHDYEEGSWTPSAQFTTTTNTSHTRQVGSYTKIGEFVFCEIAVIFTKGSSAGSFIIEGFPFTVLTRDANDRGTGAIGYFDGTNSIVPLALMDGNGTTRLTFYNATDGSDPGHVSLQHGDFGSGNINFHISVTYKTSQ